LKLDSALANRRWLVICDIIFPKIKDQVQSDKKDNNLSDSSYRNSSNTFKSR